MNYQSFKPHPDLNSLVKSYWTLEVPADVNNQKQKILPDGCIEMAFILGDDIKRYLSENEFILQPRSMVLGQITEAFHIEPTGYVETFAVRFYPYGFANFISTPIFALADKETPLCDLFGKEVAIELTEKIAAANDTSTRIGIVEEFLLAKMRQQLIVDDIVRSAVDILISTSGNASIKSITGNDLSKRRQLERSFIKLVGISPRQLGKVIRLQAALKMLLDEHPESLTRIAYDVDYFDQSHFIRDFREFTGTTPQSFLQNAEMKLSTLFYK